MAVSRELPRARRSVSVAPRDRATGGAPTRGAARRVARRVSARARGGRDRVRPRRATLGSRCRVEARHQRPADPAAALRDGHDAASDRTAPRDPGGDGQDSPPSRSCAASVGPVRGGSGARSREKLGVTGGVRPHCDRTPPRLGALLERRRRRQPPGARGDLQGVTPSRCLLEVDRRCPFDRFGRSGLWRTAESLTIPPRRLVSRPCRECFARTSKSRRRRTLPRPAILSFSVHWPIRCGIT